MEKHHIKSRQPETEKRTENEGNKGNIGKDINRNENENQKAIYSTRVSPVSSPSPVKGAVTIYSPPYEPFRQQIQLYCTCYFNSQKGTKKKQINSALKLMLQMIYDAGNLLGYMKSSADAFKGTKLEEKVHECIQEMLPKLLSELYLVFFYAQRLAPVKRAKIARDIVFILCSLEENLNSRALVDYLSLKARLLVWKVLRESVKWLKKREMLRQEYEFLRRLQRRVEDMDLYALASEKTSQEHICSTNNKYTFKGVRSPYFVTPAVLTPSAPPTFSVR